ncbi:MFS general substrate transporter [Ganoderma sinense ZZ0214-1]|uniref:MFS general substrate transporter n=1 Tax=Ganoderma sinense ZZ0214-1 TaxID=1077348 RepID=A0A2G8RSW8_9APHY|nr:MFS general substrate transporter [Ganoderma sinense ZZ0214-1]
MSTDHGEKPYAVDANPAQLQAAALELDKSPQGVDPCRVFRKLDIRLLPLVTLLFLFSFLDRTNIGNAKIAGLVSDLHLTGLQYNLCAAMFFITYCLFEVPSNLALKVSRPSLPFIMCCWGIVMLSMAFVQSFAGLLVARLFLGAGFYPGVTFYLCMWYPRTAQAQRISILAGASTLAGAFGGLLAFGIEKMVGIRGLAGWSWIFMLEGLATTTVALLSFFLMQDYPENATFLTDAERTWLLTTIKNDTAGLSKTFKWKFLWQALRDPHTYLMVGIYLFILIPAYSFVLFLPTIIAELGFAASTTQLLSVPPNAAACALTILAGILSDRIRACGPFVLAGCTTALVGYVVLFATHTPGAGYAGTMVAACGMFPSIALVLAWAGGNAKKAVVIAMVIGVANLGGPQDSPRYHPGHATAIGSLCVAITLCITAMLEFARLNRKKDAMASATEAEGEIDFEDMGDQSPLFSYAGP